MKLAGNSDTMANLTASVVHAKVKANYIQRRREAIQASTGNKAKLLSAALKNRPEETVEEHYYNALRLAREEAAGVKDRPIFVWDQGTYFFHRGAQVCELHLERLGKTDVDAYVRCKTRDGNVAGGTAYGITVEEYHFAPGQVKKTVGIPIKAEYDWGRGAFFHVLVEKSDKTPDARIDKKFEQAKIALSNERHEAIFVWAEASTQCVSTDPSAILYLQRTKDFAQEATIKIECREGSAKADTHYVPFNEKVVFLAGETSKQIAVELIQGWMPSEDTGVVDFFVDVFEDAEDTGKEQGHEIKVEILHKNAAAKRVKIEDLEELEEDATFLSQFSNALSVNGGEGSDDASILDCLMHYISLGWKVIACLIPPAHMGGGIPCFLVALVLIGICSAMISDFASMFGCLVGMTDVVTSISIVALGTSLPDTFASMLAIQADDNADNAIGNVTGSNSVNVFLGLGLPWLMSSFYWNLGGGEPTELWKTRYGPGSAAYENCWGGKAPCEEGAPGWIKYKDKGAFVVQKGKLGPSLVLYAVLTLVAIGFITLRRAVLGAEIGGSRIGNLLSAGFMVSLWVTYLLLVALQDYEYNTLRSLMGII